MGQPGVGTRIRLRERLDLEAEPRGADPGIDRAERALDKGSRHTKSVGVTIDDRGLSFADQRQGLQGAGPVGAGHVG